MELHDSSQGLNGIVYFAETPYPFVWVDAIEIESREEGRFVNVAAIVATAVNGEGRREVIGLGIITTEDGEGWKAFLRDLVNRGLKGVKLIISDAHAGLKGAIANVFSGASWQRCRAHFMRNLLKRVPKSAQDMVATLSRSIFTQPDAEATRAQIKRIAERLSPKFSEAAEMLLESEHEILAFADFPKAFWKQIWSNNPQERLNKEIRRRTDVVGIFPNRGAVTRLMGALPSEQTDEWAECRKYMNPELIKTLYQTKPKEMKGGRRTTQRKIAA